MKANALRSFLYFGLAAVISVACSAATSLLSGEQTLLKDDFSSSDSGWGTGTTESDSIEYDNGGLVMKVFKDNYFTWSTPNQKIYEDVHMDAAANDASSDTNPAFGILCDKQSAGDSFYYFAVTPAGSYVIAKAAAGEPDVILTNNGKWQSSDKIAKNASSYRIGADCKAGTLKLYVDGEEIASAADSSYTSGGVGLLLWTGDEANGEVTYDDVVLKQLK
ncbi:MAG TPA: hypothetical protein VMJ64_13845 [Anaerolineales bacterium]|nr:hypothetical protein [Anaerolineales bacterium]